MLVGQNHNQIIANLHFYKMNALDNDFIIIDNRTSKHNFTNIDMRAFCLHLCYRKNIGCDQLIIISQAQNVSCQMQIFNADGSQSGACGNATRCVAALIFAERQDKQTIQIQVGAKILTCTAVDSLNIAVDMGQPQIVYRNLMLHNLNFTCIDVGNPHAVCFINQALNDNDFFSIGKAVENNLQYFPNRTNVEFAQITNDSNIAVRVWERGVGETSACGSGACAVAVAARLNNLINSDEVNINFTAGSLLINWQNQQQIIMTGGFAKIFTGVLF